MKHCDLTLPTPEENLACDETLLDLCESQGNEELLRIWEPAQYFVVVGYANHVSTEVNVDFCQENTIPILRRFTGGGTVLQGPGCLNYSLLLRADEAGVFHSIQATNEFVLERHRKCLASLLGAPVEKQGQTDLAIGGLKFSGNAQRRQKRFLLFHGCFLLDLDLELVEKALPQPSRQPAYRVNRSHKDFLLNLRVPPHTLKAALLAAWGAQDALRTIPWEEIGRRARERYGVVEWNFKYS